MSNALCPHLASVPVTINTGAFGEINELTDTTSSLKVHSLHWSLHTVLYIQCLNKYLMTCIHHYSITRSNSLAPNFPIFLFLSSPTFCQSLIFSLSSGLPLLDCHTVRIIYCITVSDWLLSLRDVNLRFPHLFMT